MIVVSLSLSEDCTHEEIVKVYKANLHVVHPDKYTDITLEKMIECNIVFNELQNAWRSYKKYKKMV
jgi:DnaJ-class molecular chaperone